MLTIHIQLFASLRRFAPGKGHAFTVELPNGATLETLIQHLGIPPVVERVILLNGRPATSNRTLKAADQVVMFPPMTGG